MSLNNVGKFCDFLTLKWAREGARAQKIQNHGRERERNLFLGLRARAQPILTSAPKLCHTIIWCSRNPRPMSSTCKMSVASDLIIEWISDVWCKRLYDKDVYYQNLITEPCWRQWADGRRCSWSVSRPACRIQIQSWCDMRISWRKIILLILSLFWCWKGCVTNFFDLRDHFKSTPLCHCEECGTQPSNSSGQDLSWFCILPWLIV